MKRSQPKTRPPTLNRRLTIAYLVLAVVVILQQTFAGSFITPSLTHDELIYAGNAKVFTQISSDATGLHRPFDLRPIHPMYAELGATLIAPFYHITSDPIRAAHALPMLMSILLPFIMAWLIYGLTKHHQIALVVALVTAISPLNIQFSKLSYDAFFALFFYLSAIAVYLNTNSWKSLFALPLIFLGFFNYQGYKLIAFLLIALATVFKITQSAKPAKPLSYLLTPALFTLILTLLYAFVLLPSQTTHSRLSQTIFTDEAVQDSVLYQKRSVSLMPQFGTLFANRATVALEMGIDRLLGALNPTMLFLYGEAGPSGFAASAHGFFYLIDSALILIGFYFLLRNPRLRVVGISIFALLAIALIPVTVSTISTWYLLRSLMAYYLLFIPIGAGFYYLSRHKVIGGVLIALYLASWVNFGYHYLARYPVQRATAAELHERVAVEYAARAEKFNPVILYDDEPNYLYLGAITYLSLDDETLRQNQSGTYTDELYRLPNTTITNQCQTEAGETLIISDTFDPCPNREPVANHQIGSIIDSGVKYRIVNDMLCRDYELSNYTRPGSLSQMSFTNLSDEQFCRRWITTIGDN